MTLLFSRIVIFLVALFYAYGASVHILNILGQSGFDWVNAPKKWQILDVVYLLLDLFVAIGFFMRWKLSYAAFYLAAISQIVLYTLFRDWIIDVPEKYALSPEQTAYLSALVGFHIVTIFLATFAFSVLRVNEAETRTRSHD